MSGQAIDLFGVMGGTVSYHVLVDERYSGDVGTISGWHSLGKWGKSLDIDKYPELCHLLDHGWTDEPAALLREISAALSRSAPKSTDDIHVLKSLKAAVKRGGKDAHVVQISDGT